MHRLGTHIQDHLICKSKPHRFHLFIRMMRNHNDIKKMLLPVDIGRDIFLDSCFRVKNSVQRQIPDGNTCLLIETQQKPPVVVPLQNIGVKDNRIWLLSFEILVRNF